MQLNDAGTDTDRSKSTTCFFGHFEKHWEFTDTSGLVSHIGSVAHLSEEHGWRRNKTFILTGERWYLSSLI